jgi:hypothetical protein
MSHEYISTNLPRQETPHLGRSERHCICEANINYQPQQQLENKGLAEGIQLPHLPINMPFPFSSLCELLNELDKNRTKSSAVGKILDLNAKTVVSWFNKHNGMIPRRGTEAVAFLSCLFPERRPDRVFNLRLCCFQPCKSLLLQHLGLAS